MELSVIVVLQLFYLLTSAIIFLVYLLPPLHSRFLLYGARISPPKSIPHPENTEHSYTLWNTSLDRIANIQVPHRWFTHFYLVSTIMSAFWLHQIQTQGRAFRLVEAHTLRHHPPTTISQVYLCWFLLLVQSTRRLVECVTLSGSSRSKMWIGHYALGIGFYTAVNISVWIEGTGSLQNPPPLPDSTTLNKLPIHALPCVVAFIAASYLQHKSHWYLSGLRKYTVPNSGLFRYLIAPHYTMECLIYLSLTILDAPPGLPISFSLLSVWIFVCVNLGVSADVTRNWMVEKFGWDAVVGKWRMIPGVW